MCWREPLVSLLLSVLCSSAETLCWHWLACLKPIMANHPEGAELSLGPQVGIAVRVPVINDTVWDFSLFQSLNTSVSCFPYMLPACLCGIHQGASVSYFNNESILNPWKCAFEIPITIVFISWNSKEILKIYVPHFYGFLFFSLLLWFF